MERERPQGAAAKLRIRRARTVAASVLSAITPLAFGAGAALLGEQEAQASGYLVARFGSDHGTPATPNTFAVYFNPAAMGGTAATTSLTLDVAPIVRFVDYERPASALSNPELADPNNQSDIAKRYRQANTGKASLTNVLALG